MDDDQGYIARWISGDEKTTERADGMSWTPQELALLRIADQAEEARRRKRKHPRPGRPCSGDGRRREQKREYYLRKRAVKSVAGVHLVAFQAESVSFGNEAAS